MKKICACTFTALFLAVLFSYAAQADGKEGGNNEQDVILSDKINVTIDEDDMTEEERMIYELNRKTSDDIKVEAKYGNMEEEGIDRAEKINGTGSDIVGGRPSTAKEREEMERAFREDLEKTLGPVDGGENSGSGKKTEEVKANIEVGRSYSEKEKADMDEAFHKDLKKTLGLTDTGKHEDKIPEDIDTGTPGDMPTAAEGAKEFSAEGAKEEEKAKDEYWKAYSPDRGKDGTPDDVYVTLLGGDKVEMKVIRENACDYEMTGIRTNDKWTAEYVFESLEEFKDNGWIDVDTKERNSNTIPDSVFEQAYANGPKLIYELEPAGNGVWCGTKTGPGFRWSGYNLTEYRIDTKKIEFIMQDEILVYWTRYNLEVGKKGDMPDIWLVRVAYIESHMAASLLHTKYPVSVLRKDDTGEFIWSVNGEGEVLVEETQVDAGDVQALRKKAEEAAGDGYFTEKEYTGRIKKALDKFK